MTFDGTDDVGECTEFSCGTVHTIEFWMDQASPSGTEFVTYSPTGTENSVYFTATVIGYVAGNSGQTKAHGGMSSGTKAHWMITRNGTAVEFLKNNVSLGTATLGANNTFYIRYVGAAGAASYLSAKLAHLRVYNWVLNSTQLARQYNSGAGNDALANGQYAVWEFDDTGGTSTPEDNQESTANRDLVLTGTPARGAW
jgi:hypothetical protein